MHLWHALCISWHCTYLCHVSCCSHTAGAPGTYELDSNHGYRGNHEFRWQNQESQNIPRWKGPTRISVPSSWLHREPPKAQILCLRALSKHSLNSSSLGLWPLLWGVCSSAQPHSVEEPFPNAQSEWPGGTGLRQVQTENGKRCSPPVQTWGKGTRPGPLLTSAGENIFSGAACPPHEESHCILFDLSSPLRSCHPNTTFSSGEYKLLMTFPQPNGC